MRGAAAAAAEVEFGVAERVIGKEAQELRVLRAYEPDSAGGVMTTDFVSVAADAHLLDAVKALKEEGLALRTTSLNGLRDALAATVPLAPS